MTKLKGWCICRKLIDFDGKKKPFAYYPRKEHGKPPYCFKTKPQAVAANARWKKRGKWPSNQSDSVVCKLTKKTYLDRY